MKIRGDDSGAGSPSRRPTGLRLPRCHRERRSCDLTLAPPLGTAPSQSHARDAQRHNISNSRSARPETRTWAAKTAAAAGRDAVRRRSAAEGGRAGAGCQCRRRRRRLSAPRRGGGRATGGRRARRLPQSMLAERGGPTAATAAGRGVQLSHLGSRSAAGGMQWERVIRVGAGGRRPRRPRAASCRRGRQGAPSGPQPAGGPGDGRLAITGPPRQGQASAGKKPLAGVTFNPAGLRSSAAARPARLQTASPRSCPS